MVQPCLDFWINEFAEGYRKYEGIHLVEINCAEVLILLKELKERREKNE